MNTKIIGAGGGGKSGGSGGRVAVEDANTLQSKAFVQLIDLIGEGEIEGLVDGFKSIYFDDTPLQNPNNTFNFSGFEMSMRHGTQDQSYIEGFSSTEKETAVGLEIRKDTPITRTISNPEIDAVRVRISVPQLTYQNPKNGDLSGSEVSFAIDIQSNGNGFQEKLRDFIIGKSTSKYERSYRLELEGPGPHEIRIRRLTDDANQVHVQNRTYFESFTEIIDGKLRYPNSAMVALKIDSSQFSSIPVRGYDMKLLRIRVPSNYNPLTREYMGSWDGSFYIAWTDNPAWIFYDILTSERYGLGQFLPEAQIDKWALYTIAKYCDELVDDGLGGKEPRFTCNVYLQSRQEAYKVLQDLSSTFRGMLYWANGTLTTVQDAPEDPVLLFNTSNVEGGTFSYSGSSSKTRHTVALVTWVDPSIGFKQRVEYVEDSEAIAKYGIVEAEIAAFGCTSRGQANRVGKWLLYTEQHQTETVTFKTGLNGAACRPGNIILVSDPLRAGSRRGGRILSSSNNVLKIDQSLSINANEHVINVMLSNGTFEQRQILVSFRDEITVTEWFSMDPAPGAVWMISSTSLLPQEFKIVSIKEDEGAHEILAIAHDSRKYDAIEKGLKLEPRPISNLNEIPNPPSEVKITETLYEVNGEVRVKATFSWSVVPGAVSYSLQYQRDSLNPISVPEMSANDFELKDVEPGIYTVKVRAINSAGIKSSAASTTKAIIGKTLPPAKVEGFSLFPSANMAYLSWNQSSDLDVLIGGSVRIRWTPNTENPLWRNAVDIVPALAGSASRAQAPLVSGAYMAKFVDSSGIASDEEALIITTIPSPLALNIVRTIDEAPAFSGVKTGMSYFEDYGGIALDALKLIDDIEEDIDDVVNFDFAGGVTPNGLYEFEEVFDLGGVFSSKLTAFIDAESVDVADLIDLREDNMDSWPDLDGDFIDDVNAELFVQTTEDDPDSPDAIWTEWKRFFVGEYRARAFKFRLECNSGSPSHNIVIKGLSVTIDMPDRTISKSEIITPASSYYVEFEAPFKEKPTVGITANNLSAGDRYEILSIDRAGFEIVFKDANDNPISKEFGYIAKGFGREA